MLRSGSPATSGDEATESEQGCGAGVGDDVIPAHRSVLHASDKGPVGVRPSLIIEDTDRTRMVDRNDARASEIRVA